MKSRNMPVMKALIENVLRRSQKISEQPDTHDIAVCYAAMSVMIPGQIYVVSDSQRFCDQFAERIERPCYRLHESSAKGLYGRSVVILNGGPRTTEQKIIHSSIMSKLKENGITDFWNVGIW